jgi:elongation factor P--(R)-beta-lysine ligase
VLKRRFFYPAKTRKNSSIVQAVKSFEQSYERSEEGFFVAGRIVGILDDGFVLQDESGRLDAVYGEPVNAGDIVEARILCDKVNGPEGKILMVYLASEVKVLACCRDEFFIRKSDPNWKKMVIDTHKRELMARRAQIVKRIREFFQARGFMEAETPEVVRLPGMEPHLDPFKTTLTGQPVEGRAALKEDVYLITSPEYAMKKLLTAGFEKIFQLTKSFRNKETAGLLHNPEFTLLEWYRAYEDYNGFLKDTEEMVDMLAQDFHGKHEVVFGDEKVDTSTPWPRVKVKDLFRDYAGIDEETLLDEKLLMDEVLKKGYKAGPETPYEDLFYMVFLNEIESRLGMGRPVIVYDYPVQMAALAKKSEADPRYAERAEAYIAGVELCNGFTELNDPVEQEQRLEAEREQRGRLGKDQYGVDQSFIEALKFGMPPAGGNALGVDRLVMVLTDTMDINDVIFFPYRDL